MTLARTISAGIGLGGRGGRIRLSDLKRECTVEKVTNSTSLGRCNLKGRQAIKR